MSQNLKLLEENLTRKNYILDKLQTLCDKQSLLLVGDSIGMEDFDDCMNEQNVLVEELVQLDYDFEQLCKLVREEVIADHNMDESEKERISQLNQTVLDKGLKLQAQAASNKKKLDQYFQKERKNIGSGRRSSKAAMDYYRTMSKSNVIPPQFMDKKK